MITLCMDTSHKYLAIGIIRDDCLIASYNELCFKKQSENIFIVLKQLFNEHNLEPMMIDEICITQGPGSYTGIRIAMTIAKTICSLKKIPLYTISTLRLYANNETNTLVLLDARSKRAYYGIYDVNEVVVDDTVGYIADINTAGYTLVGDLSLIGLDDFYCDIPLAFLNTRQYWQVVDDVDYLSPTYLKNNQEYLTNV